VQKKRFEELERLRREESVFRIKQDKALSRDITGAIKMQTSTSVRENYMCLTTGRKFA
jgi:hypothetical protein